MNESISSAQEQLLDGSDIGLSDLEGALSDMMGNSIDYGEVYLQAVRSESWGLEDGTVKAVNVEPNPGEADASGAEQMLASL